MGPISRHGTLGLAWQSQFFRSALSPPRLNVRELLEEHRLEWHDRVTGTGAELRLPDSAVLADSAIEGDVVLGIRPENIAIDRYGPISLVVRHREYLGSHAIIMVELSTGHPSAAPLPFLASYSTHSIALAYPSHPNASTVRQAD